MVIILVILSYALLHNSSHVILLTLGISVIFIYIKNTSILKTGFLFIEQLQTIGFA